MANIKALLMAVLLLAFTALPVSAAQHTVDCWLMNEKGGGTVTGSERGIEGIINNAVWSGAEGLRFDYNSLSYISFSREISKALYKAPAMVFSADIKPDYLTSFTRYRLLTLYMGKVTGTEIYILPGKCLVVGCRSSSADAWQSKQFMLGDNESFNLIVEISYEDKTVRAYVNGSELAPVTGGSTVSFSSDRYYTNTSTYADYIGGSGMSGNSFNGTISNVHIYRDRLPQLKLKELGVNMPDILGKIQSGRYLFMKMASTELNGKTGRSFTGDYRICPKLFYDEVYYPAASLFENLGYSFSEDMICRASDGIDSVVIPIGESYVLKNNEKITLSAPSRLENGRCFISEELLEAIGISALHCGEYIVLTDSADELSAEESEYISFELGGRFNTGCFAEPRSSTRKSCTVIAERMPETREYIGSPSLIKTEDGTLFASHDLFGGAITEYQQYIYRSEDGGATWSKTAVLDQLYWSSMFENNGELYLIGVSKPGGSIVIRKSADRGITWTQAKDGKSGIIVVGEDRENGWYHTGSTSVLKANGRIYKAFEDGSSPETNYRHKEALVISADENADLLDSGSWTLSNKLPFDQSSQPDEWYTEDTIWIEGNVVAGRGGKLYNILRLETAPETGKAAVLEVSPDGKTVCFDRFIDFPGGMSLFHIKYDESTDCYIALVNNVTDQTRPYQRNVLSLAYSRNLYDWTVAETVLCDNFSGQDWNLSVKQFGFQYTDWIIDGADIKLLVRESNGSGNYHNANLLTFYTLTDYAKYIKPSCEADWYDAYKPKNTVGGELTARITSYALCGDETAYAAVYDAEGALKEVKAQTLAEGQSFIEMNTSKGDKVKLFVWTDIMKPIFYDIIE